MRLLTITRLTFLEAARRKIALAALLLGVAFLVLYATGFYFIATETGLPGEGLQSSQLIRNQVFGFFTNAGMYAVNFLTIAMGALVSADTLAGEIGSGTIQTLATKPARRAEIVLGKWLGFALLIGAYLAFMFSGLMLIVYSIARYSVPNVFLGVALIYFECVLIMTLTLACSSRFSTLATGGIVFGMYGLAFIGGFVEQVGAIFRNQGVVNVGIISSLILPSEALFRRAAYEMTSPLGQAAAAVGMPSGPMLVISIPSPMMIVYGAFYLLVMLGIAIWVFQRRDL